MTPGTILAGRYRLDDLLTEHDGARFWRATDTVLARSVGIHAVASDDPRSGPILEAARLSARVTDPHFLRVLDCADSDGLTWVVNEWGAGSSLDLLVQREPLPPARAAWITREVAEAISAAHAVGVHHGRLNPENVMVTETGAVKVIGSAVYAVFAGPRHIDAERYGELSDREADVIDLAGILYAGLTGRWPGLSPSALPSAPRETGRETGRHLRPRQVRAGVPRTLDAICDRVLNKEASQHVLPIESAFEIAAVLTDYVGDAAGAPLDVIAPPEVPDAPEIAPAVAPDETLVGSAAAPEPPLVPDVELPVVEEVAPQPSRNPDVELPVVEEVAPQPSRNLDPEATMAAPPPLAETMPRGLAGLQVGDLIEPEEWEQREAPAPPPPFEQLGDRPLFAETERRVPEPPPGSTPPPPDQGGFWPFDEQPGQPAAPAERRRSWGKPILIGAAIVALLVAMYLAFDLGRGGEDHPGSEPTSTPTTGSALPTGTPLKIFRATDFDPEGDPPQENPHEARNAIDGNPATGWRTLRYQDDPQLGGLKSGVGLVLDLGSEKAVSSVQLGLVGQPTSLEIFATPPGVDDPPTLLADGRRLTGITANGTTAVARFDQTRTRYLIVWLTKLPPVPGGFRGEITEVTVRP